ncbi:MAG: CtsR family transcriptional regulator [Desulfitobacteriaceae bacterium]|nr:CtsR family transcriptional regulator [Desulfitobacteriaceae bacterium]MDI6878907.1 CtsR family transcriptional regulator [Desulfitobacteriaceae bacterium]MDI6913338.1 CtsR family transcriptional regulator [Desulfitobacteriaceae bacterium]
MANLADRIEEYIRQILAGAEEGFILLQRGTLANIFSCAPSQINYVLDTRFTVERGFLVESRRGGGGYLRIMRLEINPDGLIQHAMRQLIGDSLSQERAYGLLERLYEEAILTLREREIMKAILAREGLGGIQPGQDIIRARLMKRMLTTLCREDLE